MPKHMLRKWKIGISLLLVFSLPAVALGAQNVESLNSLWLFWDGKKTSYDAIEVNGKLYVPLDWLQEEMELESEQIGSSILKLNSSESTRSSSNSSSSSNTSANEDTNDPTTPNIPAEPDYHAGMIKNDLETLLDFLDRLEDLSDEYKSVIYSHLYNVPQGKSTTSVQKTLDRLSDDYEYYASRYQDMIDEIDDLKSTNSSQVNRFLDDLQDDMDDIMDYKKDAFDHLLDWVQDKSDDDAYDDYEDDDRKANNLISTVRSYTKSTLNHVEYRIDALID